MSDDVFGCCVSCAWRGSSIALTRVGVSAFDDDATTNRPHSGRLGSLAADKEISYIVKYSETLKFFASLSIIRILMAAVAIAVAAAVHCDRPRRSPFTRPRIEFHRASYVHKNVLELIKMPRFRYLKCLRTAIKFTFESFRLLWSRLIE